MRYAISPRGIGKEPGARAIDDAGALAAGETFSVPEAGYNPSLVLAEDSVSLRPKTEPELALEASTAAAAAVEQDAQAALAADARLNAVFTALQTATPAEITALVTARFPAFSAPQQNVLRLLLSVAAIVLRRGVV